MRDVVAEFAEAVARVRKFAGLPCVCDNSSTEAKEDSLTRCTVCHIDSIFDETLELAEGMAKYIERMAADHPKQPIRRPTAHKKSNVVKFQPMAREPQPNATWKP